METHDTVTLALAPASEPLTPPAPGQFHMLYAFGIGEIPVSVSATEDAGIQLHTIRAVGAVSRALCQAMPGTMLGVRGPFGKGWRVPAQGGKNLLIVAGGIGLAPLRPVIREAIRRREQYGNVAVAIGARSPGEQLYTAEYREWRDAGLKVLTTVDQAPGGWGGHVGLVTQLLPGLVTSPAATVAMLCGPEAMMRVTARALADQGMAAPSIQVSLERNMQCGIGECGHCQLGPLLVCRSGPVTGYEVAEPLFAVKEL
ncbi:FAD/NAD(P)-binding protein [Catelliglobosispora koreensis]|uniref:FAD/NAD(P)-binding protein n=1 Tax=Catelliglobosispora koreensis TaxID=129052 RepID=UPI001B7FD069|nr:FAD/NAD(P)-binding protein [Catelliglobosispora koreensis]